MKRRTNGWCGCPVRYGAAMIGDRWKLVILRDLAFKGARRFGEFADAEEGVATNILASRLVELEKDGIVAREADPERSNRFIYTLTAKGQDLVPTLLALIAWSERWDPRTEVPADFSRALRANPAALARKVKAELGEAARARRRHGGRAR